MRFRLSADVEGEAVVSRPTSLNVDGITIDFECDQSGRVTRIGLAKAVPDYKQYLPTMQPKSPGHWEMHVPDNPVHSELTDLLQYLESLGSFWFGFRRVGWEHAQADWLPESDAENADIQVSGICLDQKYEPGRVPLDWGILTRLVRDRARHGHLVVPMSFLREGLRQFEAMRYLGAYFNFYFFLEDRFGRGKSKTAAVLRSFRTSPELCKSVQFAIDTVSGGPPTGHRRSLDRFLASESCDNTVDGVLNLLVHLRGNLHHFSQNSKNVKGHPLNERLFETPAYLIMMICLDVITGYFTGWETQTAGASS